MSERRAHERHGVWFPVTVKDKDHEMWAVCRDIGAGGILLSSSGKIEVGATVSISFRLGPDDPREKKVEGQILRIDPGLDDGGGTWPHRLAIAFAEPVPELDSLLEKWTVSTR